MKKLFFLFALLASIAASATVTVTPLSVDYNTKQVTLKVAWNSAAYNNRVWVWIDLCPIAGTQPSGAFTPADVANPAITGGNGAIANPTTRGFFITYAGTNSGTTVTATLNNAPAGKFNWCAYGSDYPPNVLTNTNGSYTFGGTPPFTLIAADGTTKQTVGKTIAISAVTVTPSTITDVTGYPGLWCPYTGSDLVMDATYRCTQRPSGAQNWEAWIKDTRDNEYYRIVLMPDNKWWLAQNVKYAGKGQAPNWCEKDECGRIYTTAEMRNGQSSTGNITGICPAGWLIPVVADWSNLVATVRAQGVRVTTLTVHHTDCGLVGDYFGWADLKNVYAGLYGTEENPDDLTRMGSKHANDAVQTCRGIDFMCDDIARIGLDEACYTAPVRCFWQL